MTIVLPVSCDRRPVSSQAVRRNSVGCFERSFTPPDSASRSILTLSKSVSVAAQDAGVIEASVHQQFVGVDQVSTAVSNIEESIHENLSGTRQLEITAIKIEELGTSLKEMIRQYKI